GHRQHHDDGLQQAAEDEGEHRRESVAGGLGARVGKARDDAQFACRVQTGQPAAARWATPCTTRA
ncbi:MAG: hypothetical protein KF683_15585, partial [Rubrivivax sp.]|nr:hypothetical protein [Rubrivivax sp.]